MRNSEAYNDMLHETVNDIIDSCILDGIMTMHRAAKLGYFHIISPDTRNRDKDPSDLSHQVSYHSYDKDNFSKSHVCCRCVKCNCKVAATRYASHLSNCMGLGRNSSRRANKRIAEQQRLEDYDEEIEEEKAIAASLSVNRGLTAQIYNSLNGDSDSCRNSSNGCANVNTRHYAGQSYIVSSPSASSLRQTTSRMRRSHSPMTNQGHTNRYSRVASSSSFSSNSDSVMDKMNRHDAVGSLDESLLSYDDEVDDDLDSTLEAINHNCTTPVHTKNVSSLSHSKKTTETSRSSRDRRNHIHSYSNSSH